MILNSSNNCLSVPVSIFQFLYCNHKLEVSLQDETEYVNIIYPCAMEISLNYKLLFHYVNATFFLLTNNIYKDRDLPNSKCNKF